MSEILVKLHEQGVEQHKNLLFEAQENPGWAENSDIDGKTRLEHFYWLGQVLEALKKNSTGSFVASKITRKIQHDVNPSDFWLEDNPLSLTCRIVLQDNEVVLDEVEKYLNSLPSETFYKENIETAPNLSLIKNEKTVRVQNNYSNDKVRFDTKLSTLVYGTRSCDIPDETLEHYVCKLAFKNRTVAAKELDILEAAGRDTLNSRRAVRDAVNRINTKAEAELGIQKLLNFLASKVRLNKKYQ
jgi:hypothetical protein